MAFFFEINDHDWQKIARLFPEMQEGARTLGRPPVDTRAVFNGLLWVMYNRSPWHAMPDRYPPYQTCHRRFKAWLDAGTLGEVVHALSGTMGETLDELIGLRTGMRPSHQLNAKDLRARQNIQGRSGNADAVQRKIARQRREPSSSQSIT
ncbi:transposase [Paraburkholderia sp. GAS448]|uniref:transposase n=1 Tax=Paraburkholderia sp. GAS448 TaxID=3035136 RepID=UPI003D24AD30